MFPFKKKSESSEKNDTSLIQKIITIGKQIYEGYSFESTVYNRIVTTVKVFIVATRKFMIDDCLTKASAIAYTAIVSLIPTLTVFLTFLSIFKGMENKKEDLFRDISLFMVEHSIKLNIDFIFEAISGLIDNAKAIGIIGTLLVFFTATATLRALEKSLNDIWKVKQGRSLFQKIIYYWAALTLGPVMLVAGTTVATKASDVFSSANYNSVHLSGDKIWVVGNKGSLLNTDMDKLKFTPSDETSFDFENQKIFSFEFSDNQFYEDEFRLDYLSLMKEEFKDIQFIDNEGWAVGTKGIILNTKDKGKSWTISKWGDFTLNDILMLNSQIGFISADSGVILTTENGGRYWSVYDTKDVTLTFNSIVVKDTTVIITANKGRMLYSTDSGKNWTLRTIAESKRKNKLVDLNSAFFIDKTNVWVAGNDGVILHSTDSGITWMPGKFKEYNYYAIMFLNSNEGFIAGENGIIIHTDNGGSSWKSDTLPAYKINKLLNASGTLWAIGNGGIIQKSTDNGKSWNGKSGKSLFAILINFFAPFLFIWLLFLLAYSTIPNTKVPFRYSAIGAAFTGAIWVIFILLFIVYVKAFASGTFAIYGALASIPLFLLMIYASALIILYGAEVSFTMMHPETYSNLKNFFEDVKKVNMYFGLLILQSIYFKFESGKGNTKYSELMKKVNNNSSDLDHFLRLFAEKELIMNDKEGEYMPTNTSSNIKLTYLFDMINEALVTIPASQIRKNQGPGSIKDIFDRLNTQRNKVLSEMTLKDLKI
ncbi:MAG TPA: YhjD/YihY/BrkB family envelope integrity protein [Spirochaetota bacterium]|nr:YhjD/YihY/BrkB family envelope integrity protein [Spirochaetota bacterium]HPS86415.1 YhjD/YihY/BrkB family envelope integrity protein [Spirochaetota bacterium]